MKIYNPVYGALFEVDENHPADPMAIGQWILNYSSPERGLTPNEITELKTKGKIGAYPDEFFLVDTTMQWSLEKATRHRMAIQAFQKINEAGPPFSHWDNISSVNKRERIAVNFVPGPVVDGILTASNDSAVENVYRTILANVASRFRTNKAFQEKTREHARNLVQAVREVCLPARNGTFITQNNDSTPIREHILKFLDDKEQLFSPLEIAGGTHLNRNTVRRELQQLLCEGHIVRLGHNYGRKSSTPEKNRFKQVRSKVALFSDSFSEV
jgi:hypothetical protein